MNYPSGAPIPEYGPTTEEEMITDGLEWAYAMLRARDQMNAAVHCGSTRLSPVTISVQTALGLWRQRLLKQAAEELEPAASRDEQRAALMRSIEEYRNAPPCAASAPPDPKGTSHD